MKTRMTYKYKLYSTKKTRYIDEWLFIAAEIWNHCIALHRRYYKYFGKHISANRMKKFITKLKRMPRYRHWNNLGSQAVQDVAERIERSYEAFFKNLKNQHRLKKSPPKFKKRSKYSSFTLKQAGYKLLDGNVIEIMGIRFKYAKHRDFPASVKTVTVKRTPLGEYYICFSCEVDVPEPVVRTGNAVGIDYGMITFLTLSDGQKIESPQWYKHSLAELRKAHCAVSLCKKGSNNRKRAIQHLNRVYEKVADRRRDWFWNLARQITEQYSLVFVEDLNIAGMKQRRNNGRKVSDLAYAEFLRILESAARKRGGLVVRIDRWFPSTKTCHCCGYVNPELDETIRQWSCPGCGTAHDRDVNAAINIRDFGIANLPAFMPAAS